MFTKKTHKCHRRSQFQLPIGLRRAAARYPGMLAVFVAALALGEAAQADTCEDISGTDVAGDCTLSLVYNCDEDTNVVIPGDLTITGTGAINCGSFDLDLDVGGDLNVQSGGAITANGSDGGNGGNGQSLQGGSGGGGAGGGGGFVAVITSTLINNGTISAAGGAGGAVGSSNIWSPLPVAGATGSTGTIIIIS